MHSDRVFRHQGRFLEWEDHQLEVHGAEVCHCFSSTGISRQLREMTFPWALLIAMFAGLLFLLFSGLLRGPEWDWKKVTFTSGAIFALLVGEAGLYLAPGS